MVWHAFFFVMCAMDCGSSLPMNFDIVILKMPNDWTDNTYTHSFLCLKTDLWSKNNSSNCPTFPKLLFFTPCFWCCCGAYIYIYRSCHGDRGLPGTRYITSIIIQRSQVRDLLTGGGIDQAGVRSNGWIDGRDEWVGGRFFFKLVAFQSNCSRTMPQLCHYENLNLSLYWFCILANSIEDN